MGEVGHRRLDNLVSGAMAGCLESAITYPTEFIKTRQQLTNKAGRSESPIQILRRTLQQGNVIKALYGGAGPFVVSNTTKSAVRFFVFDSARQWLPSDQNTGKPLPSSNFFAGLLAGVTESVLVVTPGETLKTKIIDDKRRPGGPQFRDTFDAIRQIVHREGPAGLYKGVVPVTLKQSSNAIVRFTSYNLVSDRLESIMGAKLESLRPSLAGAISGIVTVYCSQPFDTIKTRLQASTAASEPQSTLSCAASLVRTGGIQALWQGTTPRLVRLTMSGMISFTVYENTLKLLGLWRAIGSRERLFEQ